MARWERRHANGWTAVAVEVTWKGRQMWQAQSIRDGSDSEKPVYAERDHAQGYADHMTHLGCRNDPTTCGEWREVPEPEE